jgi:hypothetical protein
MELKLVSKNNMGAVATLLLVILLSQGRVFDFLMNTALGRAILIILILGISYLHKIFGVVAILFIVIMFNQSNLGYMEGFTDVSGNTVTAATVKQKQSEVKQNIQTQVAAQKAAAPTTTSTSETFIGREGFNIIDKEGTMLRGKRSNEVPVFSNARNQTDDVEPTDKSVFTSAYSSL